MDRKLSELETSDPAEAPTLADDIADSLSAALDESGEGDDTAPPA